MMRELYENNKNMYVNLIDVYNFINTSNNNLIGGVKKIKFDKKLIEKIYTTINFSSKPILIGGKAMEYYELRRSGKDIDFIVTKKDYKNLLVIFGANKNFPKYTPGVTDHINKIDYFYKIRGFNYNFFNLRAHIDKKLNIKIIDKTDLILLKVLTGFNETQHPPPPPEDREKSFKDLRKLADNFI